MRGHFVMRFGRCGLGEACGRIDRFIGLFDGRRRCQLSSAFTKSAKPPPVAFQGDRASPNIEW